MIALSEFWYTGAQGHTEAVASSSLWMEWQPLIIAVVGILGVVLGGALTGRRARLNTQAARRYEKKTDAYLAAIDPAFQLSDKMRIFVTNAPRGGEDPDRDKLAGEAIVTVIETSGELDRHAFVLRVLGSDAVVTAYELLRKRTDEYMAEASKQLETDRIFRGAPAQRYLDDLDRRCKEVLQAMRNDLGVARGRPANESSLPAARAK
jgi:hypothetical protein